MGAPTAGITSIPPKHLLKPLVTPHPPLYSIDGSTNYQAFETWLAGQAFSPCIFNATTLASSLNLPLSGGRKWWLMPCSGSTDAGPCDPSPICAPFP